MDVFIWLIVFILLVGVEMATFQLVTIWFALGALAAFIAALFAAAPDIQLMVFLLVSIVLLILIRPLAGRHLKRQPVKTNADSLIGEEAIVTASIHNLEGFGKAIIRGQEWTAAAQRDDERIEAGERVRVTAIRGVKLIVTKCGQKEN